MPPPELIASILSEIKSGNFKLPDLKRLNGSGATKPKPTTQSAAPVTEDVHSHPPEAAPEPIASASASSHSFDNFEALVAALPREKIGVKSDIDRYFRIVSYRSGHIRISKPKGGPPSLIGRVIDAFTELTGELWVIDIVDEDGQETLKEKRVRLETEQDAKDKSHPAFNHQLLKTARLIEIRDVAPTSSVNDLLTDEG